MSSKLTNKRWASLLLVLQLTACADGAAPVQDERDASVRARATDAEATTPALPRDAGEQVNAVDAAVDLHFLVLAILLEMERSLVVRCPCLTANGLYESASECLSAVSLGRGWIDCANQIDLSAYDDAMTREDLRCSIAELTVRTECLMASTCSNDAVAMCMTQSLDCEPLPFELLSSVVSACMITLSR